MLLLQPELFSIEMSKFAADRKITSSALSWPFLEVRRRVILRIGRHVRWRLKDGTGSRCGQSLHKL